MPVGNTYSDSLKQHLLYFASLFKKITFFFLWMNYSLLCNIRLLMHCGHMWMDMVNSDRLWWHSVWFSAAVTDLFKVWCFAWSEMLFCRPWLLAYSFLTSGINEAYLTTELLLTEYFFFSRSFSANLRDSCVEILRLDQQPGRVPNHLNHLPFLFGLCLDLLICYHLTGWLNICIKQVG